MRRDAILLFALVTLGACGGASKLSEAPRASSIQACLATRDAATGASAVAYATNGNYPKSFFAMTRGNVPPLVANDDTTVTARTIEGKGWTLTMKGGGPSPPTFICASEPRSAR